jgi:hypothetical protein
MEKMDRMDKMANREWLDLQVCFQYDFLIVRKTSHFSSSLGPPGTDGKDGKDGVDGKDGKDGQPGLPGPPGLFLGA